MLKNKIFLLLTLSFVILPNYAAKKLIRVTLPDGTVIYTDHVPAQNTKNQRTELSDDGLIKNQTGKALTEEQIRKKRKAERDKKRAQIAAELQAREDEKLIGAFSSVDELIISRDDKLASLESRIKLALGNISKLQAALLLRTTEAANLELSGRTVPQSKHKTINKLRRQVEDNELAIKEYREQQRSIRSQFHTDKKRLIDILARRKQGKKSK